LADGPAGALEEALGGLARDRSRWRRRPAADLLHQGQEIADAPMVGDLAVLHAHHLDRGQSA
jgi:hypothetical protein